MSAPTLLAQLIARAIDAHRSRRIDEAIKLYRAALSLDPNCADATHMLGVICMERGDLVSAASLIRRALTQTDWKHADFAHNYGLVLAQKCVEHGWGAISDVGRRYRARQYLKKRLASAQPRVSVIVSVSNNEPSLRYAFDSVFEQTYRAIEVIAIDDGSTDNSASLLRFLQSQSPFPFQLICREKRGQHATLNEAASVAAGEWIQPLDPRDALAPDRVESMIRDIATTTSWGFGRVVPIGQQNQPIDPMRHPDAFDMLCTQSEIGLRETLSEALFANDFAVSAGNLFVEKTLFHELNGFRGWQYNDAWDFCLRASEKCEPAFSESPTYFLRMHERNHGTDLRAAKIAEAFDLMREHIARAVFGDEPENPWYPTRSRRGDSFVANLLISGLGRSIPRTELERLGNILFEPHVSATQ